MRNNFQSISSDANNGAGNAGLGPGSHAVVIGGSMAGLLAARVLSEHFGSVTILERDAVSDSPEARKGQPHVRHLHGLLARGLQVMAHYFPDLVEGLQQQGALIADMGEGMRWYTCGGYRLQAKSGMQGALMSRPLLEWQIRRRVLALPNVRMIDRCDVAGPVFTADNQRVSGVRASLRQPAGVGVQGERFYRADLVIDASGRGTATPRWLQDAGYDHPVESTVHVNMGYATRIYRRCPGDLPGAALLMVTAEGPHDKRSGMAFPIEGDRWIVSLGGINGDHPPLDEQSFLAFARSLPAPDVYELLLKLQPLSTIVPYKFPSSLRRHYERIERFPEGYLVMGDAICSFNPVYGQGMTCAALQAQALDELLAQRGGNLDGLAQAFFTRAAKIVDIPWQMAVGADFRFAGTVGEKARGVDFINAYLARVHRATHHDPVVLQEFLKVMNLVQPPASLFAPKVLLRVLRPGRRADASTVRMEAAQVSG
jgi:2-polyprenyl-6-methoxyphenol hydroxylase-like FAD-dependent oxidoreductase